MKTTSRQRFEGPSSNGNLCLRIVCFMTVTSMTALTGCTGSPPQQPPAETQPSTSTTQPPSPDPVEAKINFQGGSGTLAATTKSQSQSPDMTTAIPADASLKEVVDLEMTTGEFPSSGAVLTFTVAQPVPADRTPFIARWDQQNLAWVPLASRTSPDRTMVSAKLEHFSTYGFLDILSNGIGKLIGDRTARPDCPARPPDWDDKAAPQFYDDINGPILWCATTDPAHPDDLEIKLRLNRGAAASITTAVKPVWSQSDLWQRLVPETWATMGLSGPESLIPNPDTYFIQPTGEFDFRFSKSDVLTYWHANRTKPLIEVDTSVPDVLAGLLFSVASDNIPGGSALFLATAAMSITQCSSDMYGAGGDLALSAASVKAVASKLPVLMGALASCLAGQKEFVAHAVARDWVRRHPTAAIQEIADTAGLAAKRVVVVAQIYAAVQVLAPVADALTDLLLDPVARQFVFQPSDTALKEYIQNTRPTVPGIPGELGGKWCSRLNPGKCFSIVEKKAQYPDLFLEDSYPAADAPGATDYALCLGHEGGNNSCAVAYSIYVRYYPVGIGWDCSKNYYHKQLPTCVPDFSHAHDLTKPRIVVLPNHQQGTAYYDSEPMYLVGG